MENWRLNSRPWVQRELEELERKGTGIGEGPQDFTLITQKNLRYAKVLSVFSAKQADNQDKASHFATMLISWPPTAAILVKQSVECL